MGRMRKIRLTFPQSLGSWPNYPPSQPELAVILLLLFTEFTKTQPFSGCGKYARHVLITPPLSITYNKFFLKISSLQFTLATHNLLFIQLCCDLLYCFGGAILPINKAHSTFLKHKGMSLSFCFFPINPNPDTDLQLWVRKESSATGSNLH